MSLGLGIFLSALLLLVAWQIDKHGAWRKAGKVALWVVGAVVVGCAVIWGWVTWDNHNYAKRLRDEHDAELAQALNPAKFAYWGIKIGMTKAEVKYLKGTPDDESTDGEGVNKRLMWTYYTATDKKDHSRGYIVSWHEDNPGTYAVTCVASVSDECEPIAGLKIGSTEAEVLGALGKPFEVEGPRENGTKTLRYGTASDQVIFGLSKGSVEVLSRFNPRPKQGGALTPPSAASQ